MAVDKVKPLKLEHPSLGGTETDPFPREVDPSADYISGKGFSFEGLDTHLLQKLGRTITALYPNGSQKPTYNVNSDIDFIEYFTGATQTNADRLCKVTLAYDANLDPTSETWLIYDTDGTTVLRTITRTFTLASFDVTNMTEAFT